MRTFIAIVTIHVYDEADDSTIEDRIQSCIDMHGDLSCGEIELTSTDVDHGE